MLMTVLAGFAGGLAGTLWGGMVSGPLLAQLHARHEWHPESASRLLAGAVLYGLCGAAAGFLFWLSWGLVALVSIRWPMVGLLFGGLLWVAGAVPALGLAWLRLPGLRPALAVQMLEALFTCLSVGLLCAFVWHRAS
jgi:hypothetical protein